MRHVVQRSIHVGVVFTQTVLLIGLGFELKGIECHVGVYSLNLKRLSCRLSPELQTIASNCLITL
jgi:hypothetical protein